jgi:hypothetical protein
MKIKSGFKRKESILLTLTRTLIGLKLRLIPSEHRELLRSLREQPVVFPEDMVKETILRLVHLTPNIYLEELFQRLADQDREAIAELGTVLQIAEASNLSFA